MAQSLIQFLISAAVIIVAGAALTQFGDAIAHRTNLGRLVVGSILIAGATSLPELAVDINAVRLGAVDLAVGDLMGSSLFNLLILSVLDLTRYSQGRMFSKESAAHALAGSASILLTAIAALFILLGPRLESVEFARMGPGSIALTVAYVGSLRLVYVGRGERGANEVRDPEPAAPVSRLRRLRLRGAWLGFGASAAVILAAAPYLARAAGDLAERSGLGGTFFGTTFVAVCTSLPEVVTTFAAVRMRAFALALGNIFGSNCFNMVVLVPLDLVHDGSLFASVSTIHAYTALCAIVVTTIVILGQLHRVEKRKPFLEPDALLGIALIVAAISGLYFLRE